MGHSSCRPPYLRQVPHSIVLSALCASCCDLSAEVCLVCLSVHAASHAVRFHAVKEHSNSMFHGLLPLETKQHSVQHDSMQHSAAFRRPVFIHTCSVTDSDMCLNQYSLSAAYVKSAYALQSNSSRITICMRCYSALPACACSRLKLHKQGLFEMTDVVHRCGV